MLAHLSIARTRSKSRSRTRTTRSSSVSADPSRTSHHPSVGTPSTSARNADGSDSGGRAHGHDAEDDNVGLANDTYFFPGKHFGCFMREWLVVAYGVNRTAESAEFEVCVVGATASGDSCTWDRHTTGRGPSFQNVCILPPFFLFIFNPYSSDSTKRST